MTVAGIREYEQTWRHAEAAMLDAKADTIDVALRGLSALDGMFNGREELRATVAHCMDKLGVESENLRSAVRRALREPVEALSAADEPTGSLTATDHALTATFQ